MYKNLVTSVIATLVVACFISPAVAQTTSQARPPAALPVKRPLTIGFVYVAPRTEAGGLQPFAATAGIHDNPGQLAQ